MSRARAFPIRQLTMTWRARESCAIRGATLARKPASIWNWCSRCQHGDESRERPFIVHRTALTPAFLRSGEPNQGGELNWVMPIIGTIAGKVDNMAQVQGLGSRFDVPWALLLR